MFRCRRRPGRLRDAERPSFVIANGRGCWLLVSSDVSRAGCTRCRPSCGCRHASAANCRFDPRIRAEHHARGEDGDRAAVERGRAKIIVWVKPVVEFDLATVSELRERVQGCSR
jgi:hypothetical protein